MPLGMISSATKRKENRVGRYMRKVRILVQFRDYRGDYPLHCHNTVHEDHAMMIRFQVVP